jgi:hypothetical protein
VASQRRGHGRHRREYRDGFQRRHDQRPVDRHRGLDLRNIATSAQTISGTTGLKQNLAPTGTALVPLAADSQVFALYTQTGTAASAGVAVVIVKYIPNNDIS